MAARLRGPVYRTSDAKKLRDWFNAVDYTTEIRAGRLHLIRVYRQPVAYDFLGGTGLSVREDIVDGQNNLVASVHFYVNSKKESGPPDPKVLWHENATWVLDSTE